MNSLIKIELLHNFHGKRSQVFTYMPVRHTHPCQQHKHRHHQAQCKQCKPTWSASKGKIKFLYEYRL